MPASGTRQEPMYSLALVKKPLSKSQSTISSAGAPSSGCGSSGRWSVKDSCHSGLSVLGTCLVRTLCCPRRISAKGSDSPLRSLATRFSALTIVTTTLRTTPGGAGGLSSPAEEKLREFSGRAGRAPFAPGR